MNDYHDLKKGKLKMYNVSFNLRDCLNEVVDIVKFKAQQFGIQLQFQP